MHWIAGVSHHIRGPTLHYLKIRPSTTIYPGCVVAFTPSGTLLSVLNRFASSLNMQWGILKVALGLSEGFVSRLVMQ